MREVIFVHAVDTEGPLYESIHAKFERIESLYKIKFKKKNKKILEKLKNKKINLNGKEKEVALMLSNHLTNYNDDWKKINKMHKKIFNKKFRDHNKDSYGNSWVFSWHCLDHVGYKINPRKRDLGHQQNFL